MAQQHQVTLEDIGEQLGKILRELGQLTSSQKDLASSQRELTQNQKELSAKVDQLYEAVDAVADDRLQDRFDLSRAMRRTGSLEHQVALMSEDPQIPDWRPDPREITGTHDFLTLKKEHDGLIAERRTEPEAREATRVAEEARKRDSGIWWTRQRWIWAMALATGTFLFGLGACVKHYLNVP